MDYLISALIVGIGATAVMDTWMIVRRLLLGLACPNYGLVGRWIAHMFRGRFVHESIATAAPVRAELALGWMTHYLIGVGFAGMLIGIWGNDWIQEPTIGPALFVGVGTVAAPFLLMQPGMGAGIAASRTPRPAATRLQSIITHAVFGFGLYATARMMHFIY